MEPLAAAVMMCVPMTSGPIPNPVAVVDAYIEAYSRRDTKALRELVTSDARIENWTGVGTGREIVAQAQPIQFRQFPRLAISVGERMVAGNLVTQIETMRNPPMNDGDTLKMEYRVERGCVVSMVAKGTN